MRDSGNLAELIAMAERDLEELKTTQIFGGDALAVQEFIAPLGKEHSYKLTLTPQTKLGVMPSKCDLIWENKDNNSQMLSNFNISQVYREDGIFEWYILGGGSGQFDTQIRLEYIGHGSVLLEVV